MSNYNSFYKSNFNPKGYLNSFVFPAFEVAAVYYKCFHNYFNMDYVKGQSLLEVGCGPTISSVIPASSKINDITMSDLCEQNLKEVMKWKNGEDGAYDWTQIFKFFAELENEPDYTKLESRVRQSIRDIISLDILSSNLQSYTNRLYDIVVTCGALECIAKDVEQLSVCLRNIHSLLNPDGFFILMYCLESTYFCVGDVTFSILKLDKTTLQNCIRDAGFRIIQLDLGSPSKPNLPASDIPISCTLVAQKL